MPRAAHGGRSGVLSSFFELGAGATLVALACAGPAPAQTIPSDPLTTCTVSPSTFATWFRSGSPSLHGVVNPANSVCFTNSPNCSFYQWSMQMFLWLTSPVPPTNGSGIVIDSKTFYDVSPPDDSGNRTLLRHEPGFIRPVSVRQAQVGPLGLPVIFDKSGRMLQVERAQNVLNAQLRILDSSGSLVDIAHAERAANGALILRGAGGAVIEPMPAPVSRPAASVPLLVQEFVVDKVPIFLDPFGNVSEVEQGQAESSVLQAQNGSFVYYAIMVNDVYAYFLTGVKDGKIQPGSISPQFPTTADDLNAITSFAAANGTNFIDGDALAVEVKTSWIDASSLSDPSSYITSDAKVPIFDKSSDTLWKPTGKGEKKLALVGMHLVGSVAGHPEMIWATFEHVGNTPNAAYQYFNSAGVRTPVVQSTAGTWLFSASNSAGPFNQAHMKESGQNIKALAEPPATTPPPFTISPSDTIRWKAWGAASDVSPNPIDGTSAASNTEIISINDSISGKIPSGDVRKNYFMVGATWTIGGVAPLPVSGQIDIRQLSHIFRAIRPLF